MTITNTATNLTAAAVLATLSREAKQVIEADIRNRVDAGVKVGVEAGLAKQAKALVSTITAQLTTGVETPKKDKAKSVKKEPKEKTDKAAKREINRGKTDDGKSYSQWVRDFDIKNPGDGSGLPAKTVVEEAKKAGLEIKDEKKFGSLIYNVRKNARKGVQK
jgi:hypothetical protein